MVSNSFINNIGVKLTSCVTEFILYFQFCLDHFHFAELDIARRCTVDLKGIRGGYL